MSSVVDYQTCRVILERRNVLLTVHIQFDLKPRHKVNWGKRNKSLWLCYNFHGLKVNKRIVKFINNPVARTNCVSRWMSLVVCKHVKWSLLWNVVNTMLRVLWLVVVHDLLKIRVPTKKTSRENCFLCFVHGIFLRFESLRKSLEDVWQEDQ